MRTAQFTSYNGPQALHLGDITTPNITPRQVLVRVAGSSVNQMDVLEQEGKMKLFTGRSFPIGTGVDFAGTISAVGAHVSGYKVGDRVWGYVGFRRPGTSLAAADYIAVSPHCLSPAPTTIPLVEAAALPLAGLAALKGFAGLKAGEKVLVIGGNGGVGSTAIQVALALGAEVDAVTGRRKARRCKANLQLSHHPTQLDPWQVQLHLGHRRHQPSALPCASGTRRALYDGRARRDGCAPVAGEARAAHSDRLCWCQPHRASVAGAES